ncbi:hypothetical protein C8J57DRAFT_1391443, partial [Mycena rebaudengoi]
LTAVTYVSKAISSVASAQLFSKIKLQAVQIAAFPQLLDKRVNACRVMSLTICDSGQDLLKGNPDINEPFLSGLQATLSIVTQLRCLILDITLSTCSPALLGYGLDPRYPETILALQFRYLTRFDLHLPSFLNHHPTLQKIRLSPTTSEYHRISSPINGVVLLLPGLRVLEAPFAYFNSLSWSSDLQEIEIINPPDLDEPIHAIYQRALSADLRLTSITIYKTSGFNNIQPLRILSQYFDSLQRLDLQGHYFETSYEESIGDLLRVFRQLETFSYGIDTLRNSGRDNEDERDAEKNDYPFVVSCWKEQCPSLQRICINRWRCIFTAGALYTVKKDWVTRRTAAYTM